MFVFVENLDIHAQALQLLNKHFKRLRHARFGDVLALDNGLIGLHPTHYIVRFNGEQFLQGVGGPVRFERPDFHFTKALATKLGLATKWLLGH